jgi:hypothetical protein
MNLSEDLYVVPDDPIRYLQKNPSNEQIAQDSVKDLERDLRKPINILVRDIYAISLMGSPGGPLGGYPVQASMHCNKIMVGMMAKVAVSNEKLAAENDTLQRRLFWLAIAVAALTVVATIFGGIQAAGALHWLK